MDTSKMTLADIARAAKVLEELPPKDLSLEQLERKVEALQRMVQSSKDKAVKQTNQRLDKIEATVAKIVELLES